MFFKKGLPPHQMPLAMIGAKPGHEIVIIGSNDPALAAEVALVTGLNGRTAVVDRAPEGRRRVEQAAASAGALVEYVDAPPAMLPLDDDRADVVVLHARLAERPSESRAPIVGEAVRVLKPGKRVVMIEGAKRQGVFGILPGRIPALDEAAGRALLTAAGLTAVRLLANVDGVAFFEGQKK